MYAGFLRNYGAGPLRGVGHMTMPFGKHRGEAIEDLDTGYLIWLEEQEWFHEPRNQELCEAVQFEIARRQGDRPGMGRVIRQGGTSRHGT